MAVSGRRGCLLEIVDVAEVGSRKKLVLYIVAGFSKDAFVRERHRSYYFFDF